MIYIFHGQDTFRMMQEVKDKIAQITNGAPIIRRFEISDADSLEELLEYLALEGLWKEKKFAVATCTKWNSELHKRFENKAEERNGFEPHTVFILLESSSIQPQIKRAEYKNFPILKNNELASWIRKVAQRFGNEITSSAVSAIAALHPGDSEGIWNDLMLLSCWKPGEQITEKDVAIFRSELPQPEDFALIQAILQKNRRKALKLLHYDLAQGKPALMVLGSIVTHFRAMLVAKFISSAAAKKFFAGSRPFWVSKIEEAANRFSIEEIKRALTALWKTDLAAKTGEHKPEVLLEKFVLR